jgi:hypothetical protein
MSIDFLYWEDCPSHERARQMLDEVLHDEGVPANVRVWRVDTMEDAENLAFPGSPTIRVNGVDIDGAESLPVGLTCRMYFREDGRPSPLPSKDKIVQAVRRAASQREARSAAGCGSA